MLSLSDAVSFSFCKRSFILGTILLLMLILFLFGMGELFLYASQHSPEGLAGIGNIITPEISEKIGLSLFGLKILGYSLLFSYLFIRAKQNVYDLLPKFSGEFFVRVFLTFFCISVLINVGLYVAAPYTKKYFFYFINYIFYISTYFSTHTTEPLSIKPLFLTIISVGLGCFLLYFYIINSFYSAYVMHFNFQKFFYKFVKMLAHPLIFVQLICFSILFLILTYLPILIVYWVLKTFSNDVASSFALSAAGSAGSIIPLIIFAVIFGGPIVMLCFKTRTGRMITLLFTLLYFLIYGLVWIAYKQSGLPFAFSIPLLPMLYLYIFFYLFCLIFVMTTIVLPTGLIHLIVQGAFHVHRTFEPNVDKQVRLLKEEAAAKKADGWL